MFKKIEYIKILSVMLTDATILSIEKMKSTCYSKNKPKGKRLSSKKFPGAERKPVLFFN
jgi:hypothetical protein